MSPDTGPAPNEITGIAAFERPRNRRCTGYSGTGVKDNSQVGTRCDPHPGRHAAVNGVLRRNGLSATVPSQSHSSHTAQSIVPSGPKRPRVALLSVIGESPVCVLWQFVLRLLVLEKRDEVHELCQR